MLRSFSRNPCGGHLRWGDVGTDCFSSIEESGRRHRYVWLPIAELPLPIVAQLGGSSQATWLQRACLATIKGGLRTDATGYH